MAYQKNIAGQKFNVLAINSVTGLPITGDAANITAKISKDSGAFASVADTNPTELDATNAAGVYVFDLSQAETNGNVLTIVPVSTTANVQIDMLNIYTSAVKTQLDDIEDLIGDIDVATTTIEGKTSQLTFTVPNQVDSNSLTGGTSPTDIYTYFTDGAREDVFKANITSLATLSAQTSQTNTLSTISETLDDAYNNTSTIISVTDQFRFTVPNQVDSNSLTGGTSPADIYTYFTDGTREEVFRADVTAIQNVTDQFRFTVSNQVDANALTGGYPSGPGGIPTEIDIQSDGVTLDGAAVWISTDTAGAHVIAGTLYTNAQGKVTFMLEAGDYYVWVQHSSVNFNNPSALTVTG